jgi:SAM-dependent methyltransferase
VSFVVGDALQLPVADRSFDAVLCSLVSEHLSDLATFFEEMRRLLDDAGRLVFSAFHPDMAAAGVEANFEADGTEYRLGAELHTLEDFERAMRAAGFGNLRSFEYVVDDELVAVAPRAARHLGRPLLLVIEAERGEP